MNTYLIHHGIKGQKWGVRRYQNEDGSLTSTGRKRRGIDGERLKKVFFPASDHIKKHDRVGSVPSIRDEVNRMNRLGKPRITESMAKTRKDIERAKQEMKQARYEKRRNTALTSKKAKVVLKNADTLSDKELREKLNRLQMEQNLRDLDNKNTAWGVKFMKEMGNQAAKQAVGAIIITPAILAIKAALE